MLGWLRSKLGSPPEDPAPLLLSAERAYAAGDLRGAGELCRRALDAPGVERARAMALLAAISADEGRVEEGLDWARRAREADPRAASPAYVAGRLQQEAGRLPESEACYREAVALDPQHARAYNNLGCVLHMQGRLEEALAAYRRALDLDANLPQANQNYASIVRDPGALERAAAQYRLATQADPRDAPALNDLGNTLRELGRHREALEAYERALQIDPNFAQAHFSRSFVLLLQGDYGAGWRDYDWRWKLPAFNAPMRRFAQPVWDGRPLPSGTVLLHAEQGLGDTLQFVRYAARVAARCGSVVLESQRELAALMRGVPGIAQVVARGDPLPPFDAHAPLMSLPAVFGTTLASIPWEGAYVRPSDERAQRWDLDPHGAGLRVGLVWAGRPQQWDDRKRSLSLEHLAPLAGVGGVTFFSLQIGEAAKQAARPPAGMRLVDLTSRIADFSDTAALVSRLDLVITIDTSVAHLAGAMGAPVWVLVAHAPDWRYHLEREDMPWYPTMRLFRQERDGDWSGAIARVAQALAQRAGA
ncbi:MAG TPA: tetratricopeptide repeat-containing glycosyltransferase family protein [Burkholderiales bacterium]|nr:tetratricopeptide repeat-containing glycosyltransferase family protein [Burkholderiales bacterium]